MAFSFFKKDKKAEEIKETVSKESLEIPEVQIPEKQENVDEAESGTDSESKSDGFFARLKRGLEKTRKILTTDVDELFSINRKIDDDLLEEIEEHLITADVGVKTTLKLMDVISEKASKLKTAYDLKSTLKSEIAAILSKTPLSEKMPFKRTDNKPYVVLVAGVNGVGKTTTIGKIASQYSAKGKKVIIAAADTFRAAAAEQLGVWAERSGSELIRHKDNSDPAAVAFDAVSASVARKADIVLIDTAGRLHTKVNLMEELKKIRRSVEKALPGAPHDTIMVVDATTGQNALSQAKLFDEEIGITGIVLTKLDGTAKGGIVVAISDELDIPICYIGVGEQIEDLQEFKPELFADALF
ncbi:signal recognition particle-docking protein FtsY [Desulforegula conservatrix]|uniref:signal recognition particle-docking protein FtsY n=1 Tax=Desulforegula conservatrix TaxID=153026 RepID=UPI0003F88D97|nr:signal recognition particle-docking protein FtsY [Desulforegula conservatrix]